ncbi:MAG: TlpA family protein disulfide reductase [Oscillospiraceae bacterium]|jgi:thiol-disulfide isomerase/thioredoxin|nr:TlpA family protein disulfide reductase [Oscillospiraceae bacterium]
MLKKMLSLLLAVLLLTGTMPALGESEDVPFGAFSAENIMPMPVEEEGEAEANPAPITEAIFAEAELTLVNYWATWCPPCIAELPALGHLNEATEGRAQVVGVLMDAVDEYGRLDESVIEDALLLMETSEASYPVLLPDAWLMMIASIVTAFPTSFLVDSEGNVLVGVVGGRTEAQWLEIIEEYLP